jgi:hypothetical protein
MNKNISVNESKECLIKPTFQKMIIEAVKHLTISSTRKFNSIEKIRNTMFRRFNLQKNSRNKKAFIKNFDKLMKNKRFRTSGGEEETLFAYKGLKLSKRMKRASFNKRGKKALKDSKSKCLDLGTYVKNTEKNFDEISICSKNSTNLSKRDLDVCKNITLEKHGFKTRESRNNTYYFLDFDYTNMSNFRLLTDALAFCEK